MRSRSLSSREMARISPPGTICVRPGRTPPASIFRRSDNWGGFAEPNAHGRFAREQEIYLQITRRWRNLAKPTIAEIHGKCIAGGLMLAWACDLIVASSDAEFCDPVVTMGVCGVEWFVHPWELGPRKAKEFCSPQTSGARKRRTGSAWSITSCRGQNLRPSCWRWRRGSPQNRPSR